MTMRSTIQDLRAHADVANDEHQVKSRTGEFADLSARLAPARTNLARLNVGIIEVEQLDGEMPAGRELEAEQIAASLRALAADLPAMTVEQSLDLAKAQVRSAEKYVSDLRGLVVGRWQAYVSQPPPAINSDLIDALAHGGVAVEEIRSELEAARGRLVAVQSRQVPDKGDVDKCRAAVAAIQRCGERLGDVVDPDIAEGIVGSQDPTGMPLTWFTPKRVETLAKLGIVDRFRVRLR